MTKTTAATITDDQIRALRHEAGIAGDEAQIVICDIALGDYAPSEGNVADDYAALRLSPGDARRLQAMTQADANAECASVIAAGER